MNSAEEIIIAGFVGIVGFLFGYWAGFVSSVRRNKIRDPGWTYIFISEYDGDKCLRYRTYYSKEIEKIVREHFEAKTK